MLWRPSARFILVPHAETGQACSAAESRLVEEIHRLNCSSISAEKDSSNVSPTYKYRYYPTST